MEVENLEATLRKYRKVAEGVSDTFKLVKVTLERNEIDGVYWYVSLAKNMGGGTYLPIDGAGATVSIDKTELEVQLTIIKVAHGENCT
jgi:hypothetical protein